MSKKVIFIVAPVSLILVTFVFLDQLFGYTIDAYREAEIFAEVRNKILSYYVEKVDSKKLLDGALNGMVSELDPYSTYLSEDSYRQMFEGTEGEFIGIGIEITQENGLITVISPMEDTPAAQAGVIAGDKIIEIDGKSIEGFTTTDVVAKLRGPIGSKVTLKILREGNKTGFNVDVVRERIQIKSIKGTTFLDAPHNTIGYVRLVKFNKHSSDELRATIEDLKSKGMKGLILDLRFNPGGLLDSSVDVVNAFIDKGLIVYTRGRGYNNNKSYDARPEKKYWNGPLVVLVNKASASASEVVAGALQDYRRAVLVGERTYGKGSVQSILTLKDEKTGLKLTTAKYYTPSGRSINKDSEREGGIMPDMLLTISPEEQQLLVQSFSNRNAQNKFEDRQLAKAIEVLKQVSISFKFR